MNINKRNIFTSIVVLAVCISATFSRGAQNTAQDVAATFPELAKPGQPEWRLLYTDGNGGLHEIRLDGQDRKVCDLSGSFLFVGYQAALKQYVAIEDQDLEYKVDADGKPDEFPSYRTLMHQVDEKGNAEETIPLAAFERGIDDASFSPSGRFVLVATNDTLHISKRRADDFDGYHVYDVYRIDTKTGATVQLLSGECRDLGEVHPQGDRFLFTDEDGVICEYVIKDKSVTPLIEGSRPYWNSDGSAIRYLPATNGVAKRGEWYSPKITGDDEYEFEFDIETKVKTKLGRAGDKFSWSPDRKYCVRAFHYDTLFPPRKGLGKVILESADREREAVIIKDIRYPWNIFWAKGPKQE